MPAELPPISDAARAVMRSGLQIGLADVRAGETFLAFVVVGGEQPSIEQMVPGPEAQDPVRVALDMAQRRVAELPQGSAFAIVRDAFLHDTPGKVDAITIEFGIAGTTERHFAAQKYRKSRWLRRFKTIGGLIYLAEPRFAAPAEASPATGADGSTRSPQAAAAVYFTCRRASRGRRTGRTLGGHATLTTHALSSWSHTQFARLRA